MITQNKFAIYQFLVSTDMKEKNLLVGFIEGRDADDAIENYARARRPDSDGKKEFLKGYLKAHDCAPESFNRADLLTAIEKNKTELGVWY